MWLGSWTSSCSTECLFLLLLFLLSSHCRKGRWEESIPTQVLPTESSPIPFPSPSDITLSTTSPITSPSAASTDTSFPSLDVHSLSSSTTFPYTTSSTIPTKNIKKKFGDFFAFKRARAVRATKTGSGDGGQGTDGVKVKRTYIADLIRPLRETKDRDRDRERDKDRDREKEREKGSEEDANICNDATTTEGTVVIPGRHRADTVTEAEPPADSLSTTQSSETTSFYPTMATSPEHTTSLLAEAAVPVPPCLSPTPAVMTTLAESEKQPGAPSYGEKRLRVTKRLRENKSQSLILLTGLEPDDKDNTPNKVSLTTH